MDGGSISAMVYVAGQKSVPGCRRCEGSHLDCPVTDLARLRFAHDSGSLVPTTLFNDALRAMKSLEQTTDMVSVSRCYGNQWLQHLQKH